VNLPLLYALARPLLFRFDPEKAHEFTLASLEHARGLHLTGLLDPRLDDDPVQVMGLRFPNPVGLAAGMDKNAAHLDALGAFGFGCIEAGTVTPRPQPGNPLPRMFRLPAAEGLINRLGFNNEGVEALVARVRERRWKGVLGINIGRNATTPNERAADDYVACLEAVYPYADYVAVNVSSPNTRDLRALQDDAALGALLAVLAEHRMRLADRHGRRVPIAVKIAPDLADAALPRVADVVVAHGMDAIIATNTTISRVGVEALTNATETGGLSGAPLRARATEVVGRLARHLQGRLPVIAVGGILCGDDAVEKLRAGAVLVQMYTGLIYRGPALVGDCRRAIARHRRAPRAGAPQAPASADARTATPVARPPGRTRASGRQG
jgi:dihydroorotate dehydrogenase